MSVANNDPNDIIIMNIRSRAYIRITIWMIEKCIDKNKDVNNKEMSIILIIILRIRYIQYGDTDNTKILRSIYESYWYYMKEKITVLIVIKTI